MSTQQFLRQRFGTGSGEPVLLARGLVGAADDDVVQDTWKALMRGGPVDGSKCRPAALRR
jgi:hypothetical protein